MIPSFSSWIVLTGNQVEDNGTVQATKWQLNKEQNCPTRNMSHPKQIYYVDFEIAFKMVCACLWQYILWEGCSMISFKCFETIWAEESKDIHELCREVFDAKQTTVLKKMSKIFDVCTW